MILGIFGKKGFGKTHYVKGLLHKFDRKIIFDKNNEYFGGIIFTDYEKFNEFYQKYLKNDKKYTVILKFMTYEDYEKLFNNIMNIKNVTLVIDEANFYFPPTSTPIEVKNLIAISRHARIDIVYISRRVYEVSPMLRSQTDELVTFRQTEKRDLELLHSYGFNANEVRKLPKYHYLKKSLE